MKLARPKLVGILLVASALSFAGCGKKSDNSYSKGSSTTATTTISQSVTDPTDFTKLDNQLSSIEKDMYQSDSDDKQGEGSING